MKRADAALIHARRMPSASMSSLVSLSPAVSMNRKRMPSRVSVSSRVSRVVPGVFDTMARSSFEQGVEQGRLSSIRRP